MQLTEAQKRSGNQRLYRDVSSFERRNLFDPIIALQPARIWIEGDARVDSVCKLEGGQGIYLGHHVHIASFNHLNIGGGVLVMEDRSSAGSGCKVITGSNVPGPGRSCSAIAPGAVVKRSFVHIKEDATLFCGVIVLPGVTIGRGAIIGAGSVVREDVPDGEFWAGVPAKRIRAAQIATDDEYITSEQRFKDAMAEFYGWDRA